MVTACSGLHSSTNYDPENKTVISSMKEKKYEELDDLDAILA